MTQLFANNAFSTLAAPVAIDATTLSVQPGQGARFPAPAAGDFFMLTLFQLIGGLEANHEVVKVTARSVDTLTIVRAQEGTAARAWSTGDQASHRGTAGTLGGLAQLGAPAQFQQPVYVPTPAPGVNTTQVATTAFVTAALNQLKADLVANSPATLDTLNELATALGNDANFATTVNTALGNRLRVDVSTQGLTAGQKANAVTNLGLAAVATSGAKADVGLGNVDNTSDVNKPISAAQQNALNLKAPLNTPSFTGGVRDVSGGITTVVSADASGSYIESQGTNNLRLYTGGAERVRLDASGNLGVGTTTPGAKLDVAGGIRANAATLTSAEAARVTNDNGYMAFYNAANATRSGFIQFNAALPAVISVDIAQPLAFQVNGAERMRLDASGNLGIGTTTPNSPLSIGTNHGVKLSVGAGGWASTTVVQTGYSAATGDYTELRVPGGGSNSANLFLQANGNVGVGTSSPSQYSHGGTGRVVEISNPDNSANAQGHLILSSGYTGASSAIGALSFAMPNTTGGSAGTKLMAYIAGGSDSAHTSGTPSSNLQFATRSAGGTLNEQMRLDASGNLLVGVTSGSFHTIAKNGLANNSGNALIEIRGSGAGIAVYATSGTYGSAANATLRVGVDAITTRSIAAPGSINASGADYAEYMTKADDCGVLAKGQIVGIDAAGKLTDKWASAVSFMVKSTDPSYVGGDVWGSEESLGVARPVEPVFEAPAYAGSEHPGTAPAAPNEPQLVAPVEPAAPVDDAGDEAQAEYLHQLADYDAHLQANAAAQAAYEQALVAYQQALQAYAAAMAVYEVDMAEHDAAVTAAKYEFKTITYPAYEAALANFEAKLEAARQKVDRIAYCGQVPVNVLGATPGQYVIPVQDGEYIKGVLASEDDMTLKQYLKAVGVVQNILPDGRANVRVKPV